MKPPGGGGEKKKVWGKKGWNFFLKFGGEREKRKRKKKGKKRGNVGESGLLTM